MNNKIGENIRKHREFKGFSQEYMAQKLGINQSSYAKIEKEDTKVTVERLQRIAQLLEVEIATLLNASKQAIFNQTNESGSYGNGYIENLHIEHKEIVEKLLKSKDELIDELRKEIRTLQSFIDKQ